MPYDAAMAKADRLERTDIRRAELEADYLAALTAALEVTAAGSWGLFNHQKDRRTQARIAPSSTICGELGEAIDGLREQLHLDTFALHREFLASRGPVPSSAVGEPKQAQAWLDKLSDSSASSAS